MCGIPGFQEDTIPKHKVPFPVHLSRTYCIKIEIHPRVPLRANDVVIQNNGHLLKPVLKVPVQHCPVPHLIIHAADRHKGTYLLTIERQVRQIAEPLQGVR
jgi:hypothetical protein